MNKEKSKITFYPQYKFFSLMLIVISAYAFILDSPIEIWNGLLSIITSRSLLITDYMAVGGPGAMLINGALAGAFSMAIMLIARAKPSGAIIMALWMTVGFGFFGKNIFNMLPLTCGVWLYSVCKKEPFINYSLASMLVATLSPFVSEFAFSGASPASGIIKGILIGLFVGFIFPAISANTVKSHDGYNLYNMGFAGGLIATVFIAIAKGFDINVETSLEWAGDMDWQLAFLIYLLSAMLIAGGIIIGRKKGHRHGYNILMIMRSSGRLASDYYLLYGETTYINMGILGILATTVTLALGADINGPTMGGIFTIIAFGAFGKHVKNVVPVIFGAVLATFVNVTDPTAPGNILAVLFSTGLAPIAGQFGIIWGIVAGFIHVNVVLHAGYITNGLNLYNNGFAAGLLAIVLVPIITTLRNSRGRFKNIFKKD